MLVAGQRRKRKVKVMQVEKATSTDGTTIAFERSGDGPAVVLVCGATSVRGAVADLAAALAPRFTAVSYDRRGRGDSGDTAPYAVEREIEDLAAVIAAVGGSAYVHGQSSGGALALRAAATGVAIPRVSVVEPPYRVEGAPPAPDRYLETLLEMNAAGRRGDAVAYFITKAVGMPESEVENIKQTPMWAGLEAIAPTLAYDAMVMGDNQPPAALLSKVTQPMLAVSSEASPPWLIAGAAAAAAGVPNGTHRTLPGTFHDVPPETLVPVLTEFYLG